jgi:hypothetical protein
MYYWTRTTKLKASLTYLSSQPSQCHCAGRWLSDWKMFGLIPTRKVDKLVSKQLTPNSGYNEDCRRIGSVVPRVLLLTPRAVKSALGSPCSRPRVILPGARASHTCSSPWCDFEFAYPALLTFPRRFVERLPSHFHSCSGLPFQVSATSFTVSLRMFTGFLRT